MKEYLLHVGVAWREECDVGRDFSGHFEDVVAAEKG